MTLRIEAPARRRTAPLVAAAALLAALGTAAPAAAHNHTGDAIAAGVVGAAIGAALANSAHRSHERERSSSHHWSPKPGVTCYDRQAACYHNDGSFAAHMTWEIYG